MTEQEEQLEQLEIQYEEAKERVELKDCILRLTKNKDYIKVIDKGYLEQEAIRLTHLLAHPNFEDDAAQKNLQSGLSAIAQLKQYLVFLIQMGKQAEKALKEDEQTREELLSEVV